MSYKQWFDLAEEKCDALWQIEVTKANLGEHQIVADRARTNLMFVSKDIETRVLRAGSTRADVAFRREAKVLLSEIHGLIDTIQYAGNLEPGPQPPQLMIAFGDLAERVDNLMRN